MLIEQFSDADLEPRHRIAFATRYVETTGGLPPHVFDTMLPLACDVGRRFLIRHAPDDAAASRVIDSAPVVERTVLKRIRRV